MAKVGEITGRTLAGRYEVLDLIGRGGMGEVYRARDRELDDLIALKVVRSELLAWPDVLERFRREVKLARRVTHANVARAFELVIADGVTFYTMELVEGMPLARRLTGGRSLEVGEAVAIAVALCDALGAAHDAGVVHRDVKPGNILIGADGRIVLTDFGIAAPDRQELDNLEGTPRFMAPEQAFGDVATPAADLYALGVVLYEMLTGALAFAGSPTEILEAKQRVERLVVDGVDLRLAAIVASATERDPARRPRSARELRRALAPFAHASGHARVPLAESSLRRETPLPTVIVRETAAPPEVAHLARGFHQAFMDRLAQWPRLRVVPGGADDLVSTVLVEISVDEQAAEFVLAASARPSSLVLRLPFDIETLAQSTEQAARMIAVLAGSDAAPPAMQSRPIPAEAHDLILLARHEARLDRLTLAAAVARCERALALAPGDPRVLAALATCQSQFAFYNTPASGNLLEEAAGHALAALAAAPELAEAHFARAHVELQSGRPVIAAVCFRAAIARAPLMAEAHEWLGRMLLEAGFLVDAFARLEDALATDRPPMLRWEIAIAHALEGRWDEVDRGLEELHGLGLDRGAAFRLRIASWRGDRAAEIAATAELARLEGRLSFERELAIYDQTRPWPARRTAALAGLTARRLGSARRRTYFAQLAAEAAGRSGDTETCLRMLLRANSEGLFDLHWLDRCPILASVRAEPRYAVIRTDVAARAEAIHDALFSDHRDQATVATAVELG
jgi:eukaryotic-like serine/threonine-protein kinase